MRKVALLVLLAAVAVGFKVYNRGKDDGQVLDEMKSVIAQLGLSAEDHAYLTPLLERTHRQAFEDAYAMGGRRRASTFDEDKYYNSLFPKLVERCRNDAKRDLADRLAQLHKDMVAADNVSP